MRVDIAQNSMYHTNLRDLLIDVQESLGIEFTCSSQYRSTDNGVHGTVPLRAVDWICRDRGVGLAIEQYINWRWAYDPVRPNKQCALYHGTRPHLHIQVHEHTERRA